MRNMIILLAEVVVATLGVSAANEVDSVWLIPSTEFTEHYESYPMRDTYDITLAKGETEHVQVVLGSFPKQNITFTTVVTPAEVMVRQRLLMQVGGHMDALVPFKDSVKAVSERSVIWLTFEAPRSCVKSTQNYTVEVSTAHSMGTLHFNIHIVDVEIPLTPSIPSEFCIQMHHVPDHDADRQKELWNEFLLERRIDPYWGTLLDAQNWLWDNSFSPWPWDDIRSQKLLKDKRYNRFALPWHIGDDEFKSMCEYMKQQGLFDYSYFYLWDEPKSQQVYDQIVHDASHLLSVEPEAKLLVTVSSALIDGPHQYDYDYTFQSLAPEVKIFPIASAEYKNNERIAQDLRHKVQDNGGEWWTYVCCNPQGEQPNFLLSQTPFHNRAIMWRVWKEQEKGFLYWAVNNYEIENGRLVFDPIGVWKAYGDGALVYPGFLFGIDEPVASVRLERWKEGQEDYELLRLVEQKMGRETAERILEQVYRTASDFTKDAVKVETFRLQLLNLLNK